MLSVQCFHCSVLSTSLLDCSRCLEDEIPAFQFSVIVIKSSMTVVDSCLDQSDQSPFLGFLVFERDSICPNETRYPLTRLDMP